MSSDSPSTRPFTCNGRSYRPGPQPIVVICVDGCADEYLSTSLARGRMPHLEALTREGYRGLARAALPTFTNVNNASIVTGLSPADHGISGNFFLDPETGEEVMMNSAEYLRAPTLLEAAARSGRRVALVTAKEKLRDLLARDLDGIVFSAERAAETRLERAGGISPTELAKPPASIYSADASLFVLRAGAALLERGLADFLYLSLTDYMQHRHAPHEEASLEFHREIDVQLGRLRAAGARLGLTADHGMNARQNPDGTPRVIYLESLLAGAFGDAIRVICPITDPYVVHHGALGSCVMVHVRDGLSIDEVARTTLDLEGVTEVYTREQAVRKLELPGDRIGDLVVLSSRDRALGKSPQDHDLGKLEGGLRTHGGRYEEMVPLILSEPPDEATRRRLEGDVRNFDIFELTCNGGGA